MNALITRYKKTVLSAMMLVGMTINGADIAKCSPCQAAAAARKSAQDAAAAILAATTIAKNMELDLSDSPDMIRAPRESLSSCDACAPSSCCINQQLQGLICSEALCCAVINEKLDRQEKEAAKCCKKIRHELNEIGITVGNEDSSVIDIPSCAERFSVVDVINSTDVDVITWLKGIYVLLFEVYQCTCHPCVEA